MIISLTPIVSRKKTKYKLEKNKKLPLNSGIQTYQILTNDDEVCIPSLSSILLALLRIKGVSDLETCMDYFMLPG